MKIVVASDSFKGSLSSGEVAFYASKGIKKVFPDCEVVSVSVGDGGEGTMEALIETLGGKIVKAIVSDPLGRPVEASYAILADGRTAVIELAAASGLTLLQENERNPMKTSTFGFGELIKDAFQQGCRRFLLGIGGSATNDAGTGMLSALGFNFYDIKGNKIKASGASLIDIASFDTTEVPQTLRECEFVVACDVTTTFCGPQGAAFVFGPQKGGDRTCVQALDKGLEHFASVIKTTFGIDVTESPGSGAAGGTGGGLAAFLKAKLTKGIDMVLDTIHFDELIKDADLVITGEGRIDSQSLNGKTPYGIMQRAKAQGIAVIAIAGKVETEIEGFDGIYPISTEDMDLEYAMRKEIAAKNVENTIAEIIKKAPFLSQV